MNQKQAISRHGESREYRPINNQEKGLALTMSASVHYLIRTLDQMKDTGLYKHRLKLVANQFQSELERHAQVNVWRDPVEGVDISEVARQMEEISNMLHNLLMIALAMGEIHQAAHPLFWQDMQILIKRHQMPLRLDMTGDLQFLNDKIVELT